MKKAIHKYIFSLPNKTNNKKKIPLQPLFFLGQVDYPVGESAGKSSPNKTINWGQQYVASVKQKVQLLAQGQAIIACPWASSNNNYCCCCYLLFFFFLFVWSICFPPIEGSVNIKVSFLIINLGLSYCLFERVCGSASIMICNKTHR